MDKRHFENSIGFKFLFHSSSMHQLTRLVNLHASFLWTFKTIAQKQRVGFLLFLSERRQSFSYLSISGGMTICSVDFDPAEGLEAKQVQISSEHKNTFSSTALFDNSGRLEADVTRSYLFKLVGTSTSKSGRIDTGDELGTASFTWRKACGEIGRMKSSMLICPNATILSDAGNGINQSKFLSVDVPSIPLMPVQDRQGKEMQVTVEPIDPPSMVQIGKPFQIEFLVLNHSEKYMTLQLQFRMEPLIGISVCGPSFKNLDEVSGNGGNVRVSVRFIALTAGLLQLRGCYVADLSTGLEIPQPALCNILVVTEP